RMTGGDPAVRLHSPGVTLPLQGSDRLGPLLQWTMTDFSAQLLKRTIQLCELSRNITSQDRLLRLAEQTLDHLWLRRIQEGEGIGLWDNVHSVYPGSPESEGPLSWSITERVTECMVAARKLYVQRPIRSPELAVLARALLSESTHLFGYEQMEPSLAVDGERARALKNIEIRLRRARRILDEQPGTACALTLSVLGELDTLSQARDAAAEEV
ncbi:MAG: hypothetical protein QOC85_2309, partial [Streptomyces sp.]|nr:hypothetical protein [Streptomyces sp.]